MLAASLATGGASAGASVAAAVATSAGASVAATAAATAASTSRHHLNGRAGSIASAVAVANDGTTAAAGWIDPTSITFSKGLDLSRTILLDCIPRDVAIAPDASLAWAVCPGSPHLYVIDVATLAVTVASIDVVEADEAVYVPAADLLVVADLDGEVIVTSGHPNYQVIERIPTPDFRPTGLAPLPDGSGAYAVSDAGRLIYVDFERDTVKDITGQGPETLLTSISLSLTGTRLYAGAVIGPNDAERRSAIVALDPATGRVLQEVPLNFTLPGFTMIDVAAGHRSMTVGTGLGILIRDELTGIIDVPLDAHGRMGVLRSRLPYTSFAAGVSRSADGTQVAVATTDATVITSERPDPAYPPGLLITGTAKSSKLRLTGTTTGLRPGTAITVHIKDLTKKKSRFVTQARGTTVGSTGTVRWQGKVPSKRVQVYVSGPDVAGKAVASKAITVTSRG